MDSDGRFDEGDNPGISITPARRSRRQNARSRAAITSAAVGTPTEVCHQRVTIERVVTRAAVGKATIHRWWPTEARRVVDPIASELHLPATPSDGNPRSDVRDAIHRAVQAFGRSPRGHGLPEVGSELDDPEARAGLLLDVVGGTVLHRRLLGRPLVDQLADLITERELPRNRCPEV